MISVEEARARIVQALAPTPPVTVPVTQACGRVLAAPLAARRTQPPVAVSAMDGAALRSADTGAPPATLTLIGHSAAGHPFSGTLGPGEAVWVQTGAAVPDGADAVVPREDIVRAETTLTVGVAAAAGQYVRPAGLDFEIGDLPLPAGRVLSPADVALLAAMDHAWVPVHRRPRIGVLGTGDELKRPGTPRGPVDIVDANGPGLMAFVATAGGEPVDLGTLPDGLDDPAQALLDRAAGVDLLLTSGGASVGDRDPVRQAMAAGPAHLDFWRIAMKPGKPLIFGHIGATALLGLPGNPVSALVCAEIFLRPALAKLGGAPVPRLDFERARVTVDLPDNGERQDFLRATLGRAEDGGPTVTPTAVQDSAMLATLATADALLMRAPKAVACPAGTHVPILRLRAAPS